VSCVIDVAVRLRERSHERKSGQPDEAVSPGRGPGREGGELSCACAVVRLEERPACQAGPVTRARIEIRAGAGDLGGILEADHLARQGDAERTGITKPVPRPR
jgi:hypothetical protein